MPNNENIQAVNEQEKPLAGDTKYITIGNTTFEVVTNYVGKTSLLDIVKSAIKRDIESRDY